MIKKSNIFSFILGAIIFGGISIVSAYALLSSDVSYTPEDQGWNVENVQDALDDLYNTTTNTLSLKKFCKYVDSKYGDEDNHLSVGTKYECDPGDGTKRYFYILESHVNSIDLIMDRNITTTNITWQNAKRYFRLGDGKTLNWANVQVVKLPEIQQIANAVNNTSWKYENSNNNNSWFCFGLNDQSSCAQGGWTYRTDTGKEQAKPYRWLYDYISGCTPFGCEFDVESSEPVQYGYWTNDSIIGYNEYWCIDKYAMINNCTISSTRGVRPVITVLKTNLY